MSKSKTIWLSILVALLPVLAALPYQQASAQGTQSSRTFVETGKTVQGRFLEYWNANGALAQQGYPISAELQEKSDTDGKVYTVQYFERAIFELHPELTRPNDVLLSLLGVFLSRQKYLKGAPGQQANNREGSILFPETGKRLGGRFLDYWKSHGGLAQQGYPISDEFQEKSSLDGKTYLVQYFERAVFEHHPEFASTPNEVLLSQLGTFRYGAKYTSEGTLRPPAGAPMYRGNPQHTGAYDTLGVHQFNEVKWKFKAGGSVRSSPAITDGMVYFGSHDGYLYAADLQTGQERWKVQTPWWVESSPAVAGGLVFFGSYDKHLHALDSKSGQERWKFPTGDAITSSPVVADGIVYVGSQDGGLYALDAGTGGLKWKFATEGGITASPAIDGDTVYVGSDDQHMYAVNRATGQISWKVKTGDGIVSSPAVAGGVVYFGSDDNGLYALDSVTGHYRWVFKTNGTVYSSPAVNDGIVYVGSNDGYLYAVDVASGQERWKFKTDNWVYSSPSVADGVVYFGSEDSHLYAVDAASGQQKWKFKADNWVDTSPAVADGVVYVGSDDGYLYAVR